MYSDDLYITHYGLRYTFRDSTEEAIAMAKDAIRLHIESLMADGEPVPEENEHPQAIVVDVAA